MLKLILLSTAIFFSAFAQDNPCPTTQWKYDETSNSCFLPSKHHSTFTDATTYCSGFNSTLVVIHSQQIETAVNTIVYYEDSRSVWWIGLQRSSPQGNFTWVDGTPLNYTDWQSGQPSNTLGANCVGVFLKSGLTGGWQNVPCVQQQPFICFIPNAVALPTSNPKLCPPGTYQGPSGSIQSPNYPANYPNNADCYYLITVAAGYKVNITIVSFRTEYCCDWAYIHDGNAESSPYLASLRGVVPAGTSYKSTGQFMLVHFTSDESTNDTGFNMTYTAVAN
uniref:C-type LECtin n=1 Tax=Plectus sambesii TaxID=2011161 RepID=A0A914X105_9BILA